MRLVSIGLTVLIAVTVAATAIDAAGMQTPRVRFRELGYTIGRHRPGPFNAITDVQGVKVGHVTLTRGEGSLKPGEGPVRTGVTAILPREDVWNRKVFVGNSVLNGNGELTANAWMKESGWLETPIILTSTLSVGRAMDGVVEWMTLRYPQMGVSDDVVLPVVGECDDSFLNDQRGRHVSATDVVNAIKNASEGPVPEGCVGAGTGMVAYRFKGGIGTASRRFGDASNTYTIGALVNCNMGARHDLRIDGVPVGEHLTDWQPRRKPSEGSIIIVVATDAPLLPHQLERVARRAFLGLGRTGTHVSHGSGDFALAFSTANDIPHQTAKPVQSYQSIHHSILNPLFEATIEAVEEAILNALTTARTTIGRDGHIIHALPYDALARVMTQYGHVPAKNTIPKRIIKTR